MGLGRDGDGGGIGIGEGLGRDGGGMGREGECLVEDKARCNHRYVDSAVLDRKS